MQEKLPDQLVLTPESGVGESAGQRLLLEAADWFNTNSVGEVGAIVVFNLLNVRMATTSFIKCSVLPLFQAARISSDSDARTMTDAFGLPALNAFPVLANVHPDVEDLADEIFARRGYPLLAVKLNSTGVLSEGKLLGFLDDTLKHTLKSWPAMEPNTAASLLEKFPEQGISQTAWSNRLNDLWRLRLLRRNRQKKSWVYQPLTTGATYG